MHIYPPIYLSIYLSIYMYTCGHQLLVQQLICVYDTLPIHFHSLEPDRSARPVTRRWPAPELRPRAQQPFHNGITIDK